MKPITTADLAKYIKDKKLNMETRDYQLRIAVKAINFAIVDNLDSIMIESPTGSGKTVMAQLIIQYLYDVGYLKTVNWTAMRKELLNQAKKNTTKIGATYKMNYVSMFNKKPPQADGMVNDECQHDATESATSQHTLIKPKFSLGLSATPYRSDTAKLFFKRIIRDANTRVLIKAGFLSKFNHFMTEDWDPISIAQTYTNEAEKWGKSIVFFRTLEECEIFKVIVESTSDRVVHMVTADSDREHQIKDFEESDADVLVNMMVLTEGFDCNIINTAFIRDGSKGPVRQMGGRVLRLNAGATKNIVQSVKTKYTFLKVADASQKYLRKDGAWEEVKKNDSLDSMHKMAVTAIVDTIKDSIAMTPKLAKSYKNIGWGIKKGKKKAKSFAGEDVMDISRDDSADLL